MLNQLYNWKRFWCLRTGRFDLSDGGYLSDPESQWGAIQHPDTVPFASMATTPCLVLLGEPGIGKSHEMQQQYERAKTQAAEASDAWLRFDLRDFQTDARFCNKVFDNPTFRAWRDGTHHLHLYLDSLDEGLLTITVLATLLTSELQTCPITRLSLRIACRTAVWPSILEDGLKSLWGDEAVKVYELVPLRRIDVHAAAQHSGLDAESFLRDVEQKGVVPLAIKPVTLSFLLHTYHTKRQLPVTRTALYLDGCRLLCEEHNPSRLASRRLGALTADQRLAIAARIAAVTVFSNRSAIWIGVDRGDVPEEDVAVRILASGKECVGGDAFPVSQADIQETLDTGLFSSRGAGRMGWAHQTYAEFLAAYYLQQHHTSPPQIMSLLVHVGDADGKIVPQLHETAAWVAGMIPTVFEELLRTDPEVLLLSDVATAEEPMRAALVAHLLQCYDEGTLLDHAQALRGQYGKLQHAGLAEQLRLYLCNPTHGEVVRRVAIAMAEACTLHTLQDNLLDIALDPSQPPTVRIHAAYAVYSYGDETAKAQLKPLAMGQAGEDPDDKLKGCGLSAVWPKHMAVEELFTALTASHSGHFIGLYHLFLSQQLVPHLKPSDLPVALQWVEKQAPRHQLPHPFVHLSDAIMLRAWECLDASAIPETFAKAALSRLKVLDGILGDRSDPSVHSPLAHDDQKRRRVLEALISMLTDTAEDVVWPFLSTPPLVMDTDLPWMIGRFQATRSIKHRRVWARVIERAFNPWREPDHLEVVFAACQTSVILAKKFARLFKPVMLDSPEAQQMRADYLEQQRLQSRARHRPLLDPPPQERIARLLHQCETGNTATWWHLTLEMTLEPHSTHYGDEREANLTALPGWKAADVTTRTRMVEAAKTYILEQHSEPHEWLHTDIWYRPAVAGYKALRLLVHEAPEYIPILPSEAWKKWAPMILTYPTPGHTEADTGSHDTLVRLAYQHAPDEMLHSLLGMIDKENKAHGHIDITRKLAEYWDDRLAHAVLEKTQDRTLTPDCMGSLLGTLLDHQVVEARALAESLLLPSGPPSGDGRTRAIMAAHKLMTHTDDAGWSVVWPAMQHDVSFGREVVTAAVSSFALRRADIGAKLTEDACADFYIWLIHQYPPAEDPQYDNGEAHVVGEREQIAHWRDALVQHLRMRGTPQSCKAIQRLMEELPQCKDWLKWVLLDAQMLTRRGTWVPPRPEDILTMTSHPYGRLVQSEDQLLDVVVESLRRLETELHSETPAAIFLWNEISEGRSKRYTPKSENDLSDYIKNYLMKDIKHRGILVNRECEIRRGQRTDIHIDAIVKGRDGKAYDAITVIIEVKGCWNKELQHAMQTQLVERYLKENHCQHGLYLVGWFLCDRWDESDYKKADTPKLSMDEMQKQLDVQAVELTQQNRRVKALVLDTALHHT